MVPIQHELSRGCSCREVCRGSFFGTLYFCICDDRIPKESLFERDGAARESTDQQQETSAAVSGDGRGANFGRVYCEAAAWSQSGATAGSNAWAGGVPGKHCD